MPQLMKTRSPTTATAAVLLATVSATLATGWRFSLRENKCLARDERDGGNKCGTERNE